MPQVTILVALSFEIEECLRLVYLRSTRGSAAGGSPELPIFFLRVIFLVFDSS